MIFFKSVCMSCLSSGFLILKPIQYHPIPPHKYDVCIFTNSKGWSRKVYTFLREDIMLLHNKYVKWKQEIGDFCEGILDYGKMFLDLYKITNVPKYRSFQYRLLQRSLVTNIQLKQWGITVDNSCYFCRNEKETVIHMLIECPEVKKLWEDLKAYLVQRFRLNSQNIICNKKEIISNRIVER